MPKPENIVGKGFEKYPERINRNGRPRKLVGDVIKDLEEAGVKPATKIEIQECYLRLINLEMDEIQNRVSDKKQPALIRIVGKAILSGKGFEVIEKLLDRSVGRPDQRHDHTTKGDKIVKETDYSQLTDDELRALASIQRKIGTY